MTPLLGFEGPRINCCFSVSIHTLATLLVVSDTPTDGEEGIVGGELYINSAFNSAEGVPPKSTGGCVSLFFSLFVLLSCHVE